ncbi:MAG: glycosyltransferase family 2 protein [Cryomorphaceae bacterium]
MISVVVPVYKGEAYLAELTDRLVDSLRGVDEYEIIYVDDRGPDDSWNVISTLCSRFKEVKGIRHSRNFGQHPAIHTGLLAALGDWIVVMDCDLQDLPEEIPRLLQHAVETKSDIVTAFRSSRKDSIYRKVMSSLFYWLFNYLTGFNQPHQVANFGIYSRRSVQAVLSLGDYIRFLPLQMSWVGFASSCVEVQHGKREQDSSGYSFFSLLNLALETIITFSDRPMRLAIQIGVMVCLTAFAYGLYTIYGYLTGRITVLGFASLVLSIWILSGIIIGLIGVVGLYVGKMFNQTKQRPISIVEERLNVE